MRDLLRDAVRSLAHDRRFTIVAVALLAVTIGLVTAVYAIVHAVVLEGSIRPGSPEIISKITQFTASHPRWSDR